MDGATSRPHARQVVASETCARPQEGTPAELSRALLCALTRHSAPCSRHSCIRADLVLCVPASTCAKWHREHAPVTRMCLSAAPEYETRSRSQKTAKKTNCEWRINFRAFCPPNDSRCRLLRSIFSHSSNVRDACTAVNRRLGLRRQPRIVQVPLCVAASSGEDGSKAGYVCVVHQRVD